MKSDSIDKFFETAEIGYVVGISLRSNPVSKKSSPDEIVNASIKAMLGHDMITRYEGFSTRNELDGSRYRVLKSFGQCIDVRTIDEITVYEPKATYTSEKTPA